MAFVNNARACRAWLNYLAQSSAKALIGKVNNDILTVAAKYSIFDAYMDYYAEVPLMGEAGVDLSAQYCIGNFLEENLLAHTPMAPYGQLLHRYACLLKETVPGVLYSCNCFLETDTASGDKEQTALFFNMTGSVVDRLLAETIGWVGYEERREAVEKWLHLLQPDMLLWHLGYMFSRKDTPIRLVLYSQKSESKDLLEALAKLGKTRQAELMEPVLAALEPLKLFDFWLDIDVQSDGTVGNVVGLELVPDAFTPTKQQLMVRSPEWKKAVAILRKMANVDERLTLIPEAIASMRAPDNSQEPYYMYSSLSHLKLRWRCEEQLPTKAYLQLKTRMLQKSINEIKL